jgi:hypothetical protein
MGKKQGLDLMTPLEIKTDAELDGPLRFDRLLTKVSTFISNLSAWSTARLKSHVVV